jgi:hypothetical protein
MRINSNRNSGSILYKKRKDIVKDIYKEFAKKINRSTKDYKLAHVPFMPM